MSAPARHPVLAVSACLLGESCRYDGGSKPSVDVERLVAQWKAAGGYVVRACPEQLGGLPTPRPPADLRGGDGHAVLAGQARVRRVQDDGDVSEHFVRGAEQAAALFAGACVAVLKARSPSCGVATTEIDGQLASGDGVLCALLRQRGVELHHEEEAPGVLAELVQRFCSASARAPSLNDP
jgi:uncharacterized protein YbbK (DUF523 family)